MRKSRIIDGSMRLCLKELDIEGIELESVVKQDIYLENGVLFSKAGSIVTKTMLIKIRAIKSKLYTLDIELFFKESVENMKQIMNGVRKGGGLSETEIFEMTLPFFNEVVYSKSLISLLTKMKSKDDYTYRHSINIGILSMVLAKWLDFPKEEIIRIGESGMVHDIGKSFISLKILNKPGELSFEEYEKIKEHAELGYNFILKKTALGEGAALAVYQHHERYNGGGYPQGLSGEDIHEYAQIIGIVDIYHAMVTQRVYKDSINPFEVLKFFGSLYGYFKPSYIITFIENMLSSLIGIEVILSNGEIAEVLYADKSSVDRPVVRVKSNNEIIDLKDKKNLEIKHLV